MSTLAGKRFLTVDDEADVCEVIVDMLELEGAETETANSINAGIERLESQNFDLLFLDFNIPGGGSTTFLEKYELLLESKSHLPPIIIVTGETMGMKSIKSSHVKKILLKPFARTDLFQQVKSVLDEDQ